MTASGARRRRAALVAFGCALAGLLTAGGLGYIGVQAVLNSSAGSEVDVADVPRPSFAYAPVAFVGVVDDDDRLTSTALLSLTPQGVGGYVVPMSAFAVTNAGADATPVTLADAYADRGADGLRNAAESLTTVAIDLVEVIDSDRAAALLDGLPEIDVELASPVIDTSTDTEIDGGVLDAEQVAAVLAATDADQPPSAYEPARAAAWSAIAAAVGDGVRDAEPIADDASDGSSWAGLDSLDAFVERLFSAPVQSRPLATVLVDGQVEHDRAEMLMVWSVVAPARIGAPLEGAAVRLVVPGGDRDLTAVARQAVITTLDMGANVVSVALTDAEPADATTIVAVDEPGAEQANAGLREAFGAADVGLDAALPIGVEVQVTLGADWYSENE